MNHNCPLNVRATKLLSIDRCIDYAEYSPGPVDLCIARTFMQRIEKS